MLLVLAQERRPIIHFAVIAHPTAAGRRRSRREYTYDPGDPGAIAGGPICCTGDPHADGNYDQSEVESRHDLLVYTTAPLQEGIEVTGAI